MTLYLKYRPQKIADLDLAAVRDMLGQMLAKGVKELPHAWLFTGPRGTGKTSSARILAKALNCQKPDGTEPCGVCESCVSIGSGTAVDVVEIDAASNRGIDEIRQLREQVGLAPMYTRMKVFIIDEVHMLTTEAANALLKTLEEPPKHVCFILCTTDPQRLPDTVISRCTRVQFKKPTLAEAVESLQKVVRGEKMKVDADDLVLVAKAAKGSFRDGTKILEQVGMVDGGVKQVLGAIEIADPEAFLKLVKDGDGKLALEIVNKLNEQGISLRTFVERCVEVLREELLVTMDKSLIELIEGLDKAYEQMRTSAVQQLPLEILVIQWAKQAPVARPIKEAKMEKVVQVEPEVDEEVEVVVVKGDALGKLISNWGEVMKEVRPKNHSVEALLKSTQPKSFDGKTLMLEVFYKFHKDKLETDKCKEIVEQAVAKVMGASIVRLKLMLGEGKKKVVADEDLVKAAEEIFK